MQMALSHLRSARQPLMLGELETLCDVPLEPSALASVPQRTIGGVVFYWHPENVAPKPAAGPAGGKGLFAAANGEAPRKRTVLASRRRNRSDEHLAELRRKKQMIEAHTAVDAKGAEELVELAQKWADAGLEALELLKQRSNSDKPLSELCKDMDIKPDLLGIDASDPEDE